MVIVDRSHADCVHFEYRVVLYTARGPKQCDQCNVGSYREPAGQASDLGRSQVSIMRADQANREIVKSQVRATKEYVSDSRTSSMYA